MLALGRNIRTISGAALLLLAAACGGDAKPAGPPRAPLTAAVATDEALLRRPAVAVKVENAVAARPQAGLEHADIVVEQPVEGGITRFIAIYHSRDAERIGPVRSARAVDADLLRLLGTPVLAFSGAARSVLDSLRDSPLELVEERAGGEAAFLRDPKRRAPHNLYTSTEAVYALASASGPPSPLFRFGNLRPAPGGEDATWPSSPGAVVDYSTSAYEAAWDYEPARRRYLRSAGGEPAVSAAGVRLSARNVVVLYVDAVPGAHRDAAGNATPEVRLTGSGRAVVLRDGVRIDATWVRPSLGESLRLADSEGRPVVLAAGQTWVELVPPDAAVEIR